MAKAVDMAARWAAKSAIKKLPLLIVTYQLAYISSIKDQHTLIVYRQGRMGGKVAKAAAMADSLTNGKIAQEFINCHCLAWLVFAVAALKRRTATVKFSL